MKIIFNVFVRRNDFNCSSYNHGNFDPTVSLIWIVWIIIFLFFFLSTREHHINCVKMSTLLSLDFVRFIQKICHISRVENTLCGRNDEMEHACRWHAILATKAIKIKPYLFQIFDVKTRRERSPNLIRLNIRFTEKSLCFLKNRINNFLELTSSHSHLFVILLLFLHFPFGIQFVSTGVPQSSPYLIDSASFFLAYTYLFLWSRPCKLSYH